MEVQSTNTAANGPPTFEKVWAALMENREEIKETTRSVNELSKRFGDLGNRFGEMAEHLVLPGIEERFKEHGLQFRLISPGGIRIFDENNKVKTEIDILLENNDCIIAVEVKTKPVMNDIEHHIKRLEILREFKSGPNDGKKKIRGALAGAIFPEEVKNAALEAGFYVLMQSGDTMKMSAPDEKKMLEL